MKFEWDEDKNRQNIKKHNISFETAVNIFKDPHCLIIYDFIHSLDEDRYIAIGKIVDVLFVVYTERPDCTRLISARIATENEKRTYYDQNIYT